MQTSSQHSKQFAAVGNWSSILTYTVILVVFYALPNFALAHEECHEKGFGDFREPPTEMMRPMPPGEMMAELPPFPMEALDLSETQRDKVFQIVHSAEPSLHEKQKVIRKTQELLHQLTTADQFDATKARLIADEHAKALADLLYIHTETQAKVWGILTDMQRNLLNEKFKPHDHKP